MVNKEPGITFHFLQSFICDAKINFWSLNCYRVERKKMNEDFGRRLLIKIKLTGWYYYLYAQNNQLLNRKTQILSV